MIVAFLFALQSSPVPDLLARIDGRDPDACFAAIADLADLPPERRAEIEKGAAQLPAFYRDALLAELKLPAASRVAVEGRRTIRAHLESLERSAGLVFDASDWERGTKGPLEAEAELSFRNAPAMRALASLSAQKDVLIERDGLTGRLLIRTVDMGRVWALGQRSLAVLHKYGGHKKWIEPARPSEWTARLDFNVVMGPGDHVSGWKDIRVVEAVSEKGDDLRRDPASDGPSMLDFPEGPQRHDFGDEAGFSVSVRLPEGVRMAARLKMSAVAQVITKFRSAEAEVKEGEGRGVSAKDRLEFDVKQIEPMSDRSASFILRVRAPDLTGRELSRLGTVVEMTCLGHHRGSVKLELKGVGEHEAVYDGRWTPGIGFPIDDFDEATLEKVTVRVADGLGERTIFAEFRDIPLR